MREHLQVTQHSNLASLQHLPVDPTMPWQVEQGTGAFLGRRGFGLEGQEGTKAILCLDVVLDKSCSWPGVDDQWP